MNSLNVEQIQEIIPHRHPFLLIDKIEDYVPGEYAIGYKGVSYHEDFFRGHFPQKAVMPGVLILEALAQTGAVAILSVPENQGKIAFFGGVQKCRFKGMVFPGDQLKLETKIIKRKGPVGVGEAVATVNGKVVLRQNLHLWLENKKIRSRRNDREDFNCEQRGDCSPGDPRLQRNGNPYGCCLL